MYKKYWGLQSNPFQNVPDPDVFFPSSVHEEAMVRLMYVIDSNKGAGLLTGEIGSGKTTISRALLKKLNNNRYDVGLIINPSLSSFDFLQEINYQFGITPVSDSKAKLIQSLNEKLLSNFHENKETVLMIDEAQVITDARMWEELRLLLNFQLNNYFLLTIIIMGQPELKKTIHEIKQLDQRIAVKYHLRAFNLDETKKYVIFRLKKSLCKRGIFTLEAIQLIHDISGGIPREINKICDMALLTGYLNKEEHIDMNLVESVMSDRMAHGG